MGAEISLKAFSIVSFLQEALDDSELRLVSDVFKLFLIENDGSYFLALTGNGTISGQAEVLKKLKMKELNTLDKDECTVDDIDKGRELDNQVGSLQVSKLKILIFLRRLDITVSPVLTSCLMFLPASLPAGIIKTHEIFIVVSTLSLVRGGNKYVRRINAVVPAHTMVGTSLL